MSVRDIFGADKEKEVEGVVIDYGSFNVTVARAGGGNKAFDKEVQRLSKPYARIIQNLDNDVAEKILMSAYAKTVILDWDGVKLSDVEDVGEGERDGTVPCTYENVMKIFESIPDFYEDIKKVTRDNAMFKVESMEANAKN